MYDQDGRLAGLARADRDTQRDEWTIVELDAVAKELSGETGGRVIALTADVTSKEQVEKMEAREKAKTPQRE